MIGVKSQRDPRDSIHHGGWMMKVICWCLLVIFMFFLPNEIVSFYGKIVLPYQSICLYSSITFYLKFNILIYTYYALKKCIIFLSTYHKMVKIVLHIALSFFFAPIWSLGCRLLPWFCWVIRPPKFWKGLFRLEEYPFCLIVFSNADGQCLCLQRQFRSSARDCSFLFKLSFCWILFMGGMTNGLDIMSSSGEFKTSVKL